MTEIIVDTNQDIGREFRTVTASTKVTDQELAKLESAAAARGVRLGEWIRDVLFREAKLRANPPDADPQMVEIMGLQMFLTRVLSAMVCGDHMSREQYQELMRNVKANKRRAARDAMAQYTNQSEEEDHG
jgi:DNA-binding FadR family transcriptional regulator